MEKIYLIIDVYYSYENVANIIGIRFKGIGNNEILSIHHEKLEDVLPYCSGEFYRREMPCIIKLLEGIDSHYDVIIIDGYVYLDGSKIPGLGRHLYDNLSEKKPIIGIAKNKYKHISDVFAVYRGVSKRPLYVTTVEFDLEVAKSIVKNLNGDNRLPDIVQKTDYLSRNT